MYLRKNVTFLLFKLPEQLQMTVFPVKYWQRNYDACLEQLLEKLLHGLI